MSVRNHEGHFSTFKTKKKKRELNLCKDKMRLKSCSINMKYSLFCLLYKLIHKSRDQMMTVHIHIVFRGGRVLERSKRGPKTIWNWTNLCTNVTLSVWNSDSHDGTVAHYLWWDHLQDEFYERDTGISTQFFGAMIKWQYCFVFHELSHTGCNKCSGLQWS